MVSLYRENLRLVEYLEAAQRIVTEQVEQNAKAADWRLTTEEMTEIDEIMDMRRVDEHGMARLVSQVIARAEAEDALIHVSLDMDFIDPALAPGVSTPVPGGANLREAHLAMEMLCDCGRVAALDIVELNLFEDERARTARLAVDLAASLFGRRIVAN